MFNPRGNMPSRPRGPNIPDPIPRGPFQGSGPGGLQRQLPPNSADGMPQRFMGSEMQGGFPRPNVQMNPHRMDPRQAAERLNMEQQQQQQQKVEGCASHWDNPFPPGNNSRSQPIPGRMSEHPTGVQSRYTSESASSILASFGLSNEDLEELSRYPDDQLTPENMPLILRDIRMRKSTYQLPNLPPPSREKENFRSDDGRGSMVKSKVIDYGHESKYAYDEGPLEVKVYSSDVSSKDNMKGFQTQQTASSSITVKQMNAVEELIRQMGFQRNTPNTQPFFPMDTSNKMSGLCLPSAGAGMPPAVQPIMPPVGPPIPPPGIPPVVQQALPPPPVAQPMMPNMSQPPPPFVPEILGGMNRRDRIHHESRPTPSAPPEPSTGEKTFQKEAGGPIESPFGVVKASWLPVFLQADAQKMKRLPTPSMMNDYYAASPRIFPHMCSLCNVECRHLKDWLQHQNSATHLESCRQLRQQYPDWNPESHSSSKRREGHRNENNTPRRRSASASPKRSRRSSSGHTRRRTRSRSRSPRHRSIRQRSRSPRQLFYLRRRSRSPWRPHNSSSWFRRSSSRERGSRRLARTPDKALEAKRLGSRQGFSGTRRTTPEVGDAKTGNPPLPPKPYKKEGPSHYTSAENFSFKVMEAADGSSKEEIRDEGKCKKQPLGAPANETEAVFNKFWTSKSRSLGTVLQISDLPDDGFTDHDIKKIVQPFGKVSDILVDRCRKEAYLEMNYKEAVTAAVKYGETTPVLVNGKRVKISVAEKPKAASSQSKGNEKVEQDLKDSALNMKKDQVVSVVKMVSPGTSASKTDTKKSGKDEKVAEPKVPVKPKKSTDTKKSGGTAIKENDAADTTSEEAKNLLKTKKATESTKPGDSKIKEPLKVKKPVESKVKEYIKSKKVGESKTREPLKAKKVTESKEKEPLKAKKVPDHKVGESKTREPLKAKKVTEPKAKEPLKVKKVTENKVGESKAKEPLKIKKVTENKVGESKAKEPLKPKKVTEPKKTVDSEAKEPLRVKKVVESKEALKSQKPVEAMQAGESKAEESSKPAETPAGPSGAVKSCEAGESTLKEAEEICVVVISNLPETGLTLDEISNLAKPFGKVRDILIVSSPKKAYVEISRKSADSMVKFYTCFPMWVERNQLCITLAPELKDLKNEEAIFIAMIKYANPKVNTEMLHTQFVHLGNLPDVGYSELEILCVGLRFGRVDHYMVITNKNKAILQLNSAESAASMCRFLKRYPYSLGETQLTISRSPKIEPSPVEVTRKEVKKQEPSKESPDLKTIPEGTGVVHPSAVSPAKPTEATEDHSSNAKAIPDAETEHSDTEKMVGEATSKSLKTEDSEALKEDFRLGIPSTRTTVEDLEMSEMLPEEVLASSSSLEKEEKSTDKSDSELLREISPSAGEKTIEELAPLPGKPSEELPSASESMGALSASTMEGEDSTTNLRLGGTEALLEEKPSADALSNSRLILAKADSTEATLGLAEMPAFSFLMEVEEEELEGPCTTAQTSMEVATEPAVVEMKESGKERPHLQMARAGVTMEKHPEESAPGVGEVKAEAPEENAKTQNPEQSVPKAQQGKRLGQSKAEESGKTSAPEAEPAANAEAAVPVSRIILKASNVSKARASARRKEEEKSASKLVTRSQGVVEKMPAAAKPASQPRPAGSRSNVPDSSSSSSKSKLNMSSVVVVVLGSGKSSSQQEKDSPLEAKGSPKQSREQESKSSTLKRDSGGNKGSTGKNTRSSKSNPKPKEEEELFPFNLDEFVTMDEVVDEVDSPSQPKKNPVRGKRKDPPKKSLPYEPSSKRKKAKTAAGPVAKSEISFVTLDEIGEDEGGMTQVELLNLEAMSDAHALVTVDEVNEEEELFDEVIKDPQSLVTLDEISEQEDAVLYEIAKGAFAPGENEPDLKAEPLVTVDEIGEVEELPLNEPSHFKDEEAIKCKEDEEVVVEDAGDLLSSQIPEDPSILVTVDEIHEDSDDQPLVTLDEVTEEDEDFLEDFNRLKEEFSFVTVDEVGSEEEEEEKSDMRPSRNLEEVTKAIPENKTAMSFEEAEQNILSSAELEDIGIPADTLLEDEVPVAQLGDPERESSVEEEVEIEQQTTTLEHKDDAEEKDLENTEAVTESDSGCRQLLTEPVVQQKKQSSSKESNTDEDQQSPDLKSRGEEAVAEVAEMEVEGSSAMTPAEEEEEKGDAVATPSPGLGVSTEELAAEELEAGPKPSAENPDLLSEVVLGNCREAAPSPPCEKPSRDAVESECEEPEAKQRKVDSEKLKTPRSLKDLDFLVPKAGYFCQICSCFCVDEESMKTHCLSQLHHQKMEKFMIKSTPEEEDKEEAEEESLT